jgi:hypothetical protein
MKLYNYSKTILAAVGPIWFNPDPAAKKEAVAAF